MHTLDIVHVTNSIPEEGGAVGVSDVPVAVSDVRAMIMLHLCKHLLYTSMFSLYKHACSM